MVRVARRDVLVLIAIVALLTGVSAFVWVLGPVAFGFFLAAFGAAGGLLVLYEVHNTKRIAQAEFIRDLNTAFASDERITRLWSKLLLNEEIEASDRPLISSYLTFFETIHLLLDRNVLRLSLVDDLFRNRFFTAVGNTRIQELALVAHAGAFRNIHSLISSWSEHLERSGTPQHPGYFSYIRGITAAKGFRVQDLSVADIDSLADLQTRVLESVTDSDQLRANDREMLIECLEHHVTLGAYDSSGRLTAAAVLFDPGTGPESIKRYVSRSEREMLRAANIKVVLVDPIVRRSGLARTLVELLEDRAIANGKRELLCTIHRRNLASKALFTRLGYRRQRKVSTQYGPRDVYARRLPVPSYGWAR